MAQTIGRQIPRKLADQLPINLELYRYAINWVKAFEVLRATPYSKRGFKESVERYYRNVIGSCKNEKDVQKIISLWQRWGYLPESPHSRKWAC